MAFNSTFWMNILFFTLNCGNLERMNATWHHEKEAAGLRDQSQLKPGSAVLLGFSVIGLDKLCTGRVSCPSWQTEETGLEQSFSNVCSRPVELTETAMTFVTQKICKCSSFLPPNIYPCIKVRERTCDPRIQLNMRVAFPLIPSEDCSLPSLGNTQVLSGILELKWSVRPFPTIL